MINNADITWQLVAEGVAELIHRKVDRLIWGKSYMQQHITWLKQNANSYHSYAQLAEGFNKKFTQLPKA